MNGEWLHVEIVLNVQKSRRRIWTLKGPTSKICSTTYVNVMVSYEHTLVVQVYYTGTERWRGPPLVQFGHSAHSTFILCCCFFSDILSFDVQSFRRWVFSIVSHSTFRHSTFSLSTFSAGILCTLPWDEKPAGWGRGQIQSWCHFSNVAWGRGREMEMTTTQTSASRPHANFTRCEKIAFYSAKIHDHLTNWLITKGHNNTAYVLL